MMPEGSRLTIVGLLHQLDRTSRLYHQSIIQCPGDFCGHGWDTLCHLGGRWIAQAHCILDQSPPPASRDLELTMPPPFMAPELGEKIRARYMPRVPVLTDLGWTCIDRRDEGPPRGSDCKGNLEAWTKASTPDHKGNARGVDRQGEGTDFRRRIELDGAVIGSGMGDWEVPEVVAVLLDGRDRVAGLAPTMKLGMRKRGEAAPGRPVRAKPATMPSLH